MRLDTIDLFARARTIFKRASARAIKLLLRLGMAGDGGRGRGVCWFNDHHTQRLAGARAHRENTAPPQCEYEEYECARIIIIMIIIPVCHAWRTGA